VHITAAGRTDVGVIRSGNEDSYLMVPDRGIFVVADGMGGHAAGEVASEMAVTFVARELDSLRGLTDKQVAERMQAAIKTANGAIFQRTLTEHDKRGMGTTVTALALFESRFLIGQVGDSRAYLLRDNRLNQLTKDHSYVQEQVDAGYLTPEQARTHPYSNVITRCVGANSDVVQTVMSCPTCTAARSGRRTSFCSPQTASPACSRIISWRSYCLPTGCRRMRWTR
jgi:PPM family protein phosphatase